MKCQHGSAPLTACGCGFAGRGTIRGATLKKDARQPLMLGRRSCRPLDFAILIRIQGRSSVRITVVLALALSVSGCGMLPKKETPEQTAAASRFYPGKSIDQVRAASTEVLNLLAPGKMKYDAGAAGIAAKREYGYVERRMGYQGSMTTFYNVSMTAVSWYTVSSPKKLVARGPALRCRPVPMTRVRTGPIRRSRRFTAASARISRWTAVTALPI